MPRSLWESCENLRNLSADCENDHPPVRIVWQTKSSRWFQRLRRLSKKFKSVAVGGPAPTMVTPTGKFCGKLCARSEATSARFPVKFCREGFQKGELDGQAKPCRTGPSFAACRVSRHAEAVPLGGTAGKFQLNTRCPRPPCSWRACRTPGIRRTDAPAQRAYSGWKAPPAPSWPPHRPHRRTTWS